MPTHSSTSTLVRTLGLALCAAAIASTAQAQGIAATTPARALQSSVASSAGTGSVAATLVTTPPVIDGLDTDPIWQSVPLQTGFREVRPTEDADPKQNTEFRVAYDAKYLYVFVRAYDTAPDSIIKLLSRRDDQTNSDQIGVMIDSYHDKRTGYEFIVNPVGVKSDYSIAGDGNEDGAWNAIWDVATQVDAQGWTAEYRIPFSQLRFARSENMTFGFLVWRDLARHTAALSWPLFRQSRSGFPSQFGELTGLTGVESPEKLELSPYVLTQNEPDRSTGGLDRNQAMQVGGDLKYAVAPNITLNATVNPDFGQVEADPSVLNLGAFETFFSERRPFFVEGSNVFDFRINCFVVVDCQTGEALFYSRRIGRAPQLGQYDDGVSPTSSRILGAAKLTGRFQNGTSIGFMDAATQEVQNKSDQTMEPFTNYAVARVNRDFDNGNGSYGIMATGVNRSLDQWSRDFLAEGAYSGGIDARRRRGRYEVSGSLMGSYLTGDADAIARTQTQPAHYFQRPDDKITYDPTKTSLSGSSVELRFAKVSGLHTRFETGYGRRSAGFETNDMGFLRRADQQTWTNWWSYRWAKPNRVFQRLNWNVNYWMYWTLESGLLEERAINTNFHTQLNNRWGVHLGGTQGVGQTYCARGCTRGGPALKLEPSFSPWGGFDSDQRKKFTFGSWFNYNRGDGGRSHYFNASPYVAMKVSSQFNTQLSLNYSRNDDDSQWWGNFTDAGSTHYTFADLQQRELGLTWRLDYTFTPAMSFQWYASPFISKGTFSRVREVADARASNYDDRFVTAPDSIFTTSGDTVVTTTPGGFNFMAFNSNAVFRWEYRPGSTLFVVWSQGRGRFNPQEGNDGFQENIGDLFHGRASDRFLVKVSYWFNR
ncbi:MAG TPA: DUF5916 domain-containing protein [Gemmatimonadales bacterium]|nr:DUF5916 domain-containing protein [Gemmatimonadales bacterium]